MQQRGRYLILRQRALSVSDVTWRGDSVKTTRIITRHLHIPNPDCRAADAANLIKSEQPRKFRSRELCLSGGVEWTAGGGGSQGRNRSLGLLMSNNYQAPVGGASSLFAQLSHLLDHLVAEDLSPDAILEALTSQVELLLPSFSEVDRDVVDATSSKTPATTGRQDSRTSVRLRATSSHFLGLASIGDLLTERWATGSEVFTESGCWIQRHEYLEHVALNVIHSAGDGLGQGRGLWRGPHCRCGQDEGRRIWPKPARPTVGPRFIETGQVRPSELSDCRFARSKSTAGFPFGGRSLCRAAREARNSASAAAALQLAE